MISESNKKRTDVASRVIKALPKTIYKAFLSPEAIASWLPPRNMKGHIYEFDASVSGAYRMSLIYLEADHSIQGKTSKDTDVIKGRFLEFTPNEKIVQVVEFESEDSDFAGEMIITWSLATVLGGTKVTVVCENVPEGVKKEDHEMGLSSTLENLADYTE